MPPKEGVVQEIDTRFKALFKKENIAVSLTAFLLSFFILYTAWFGFFPNLIQRSIYVGFGLVLAFLINPSFRKGSGQKRGWTGYAMILLSFVTTAWVVVNYDRFMTQSTTSTLVDLVFGTVLVLLLLEAARRTMGSIFVILTGITIIYAFVGPWLPGDFAHRGFSFEYIIQHLYISSYGIWGTTTGTMVSMVSIFIILGSILAVTGGAKVFLGIATALGGRSVGGPAKVAVIGSSLFGMVSGSASANGAVIGAMTIPMMKKCGYSAEFSAAAEAVAGTGGQIMPPIMGAGAFLIAEKLGVPYLDVAIAAVIPAVVYYISLFAAIHFISLKLGMKGVADEEIAESKKEMNVKKICHLFIPLALLVGFLVRGYTVALAGVISISLTVVLYVFTDLHPGNIASRIRGILLGLVDAGIGIVLLAILGACADIIIGMLSLTGLGVELSAAIYSLSGGKLLMGLLLAMITTLILGMGLPTTAAYILASSVVAPALSNFDVNPMAINLFLFYFACISAFTPPVCVAIYITAGIAQANWVRAGIVACQLGAAAFLVPYLAIYDQALIMNGSIVSIAVSSTIAIVGSLMLAGGIMGNFYHNLSPALRLVLIVGALLTLYPGYISSLIGFCIGVMVYFIARKTGGGVITA